MLRICGLVLAATIALPGMVSAQIKESPKQSPIKPAVYTFQAETIDGRKVKLDMYKGKVLLIVNVASECGATPQYAGLQKLYEQYAKEGLVVLGFPSNEFGSQEPGTNKQIKAFCTKNYGVKFDMFAKIKVNGNDAHPLYKHLTSKKSNPKSAGPILWNFEKFVIGRDGMVVARFATDVEPNDDNLQGAIRKALGK